MFLQKNGYRHFRAVFLSNLLHFPCFFGSSYTTDSGQVELRKFC